MSMAMPWSEFKLKEESERAAFFTEPDGRMHSTLFSQQFSLQFLNDMCELADGIRQIEDNKPGADYLRHLLSDKRVMLYFRQPSTRTRLSFEAACDVLGIRHSLVHDASTSSEAKGESALDTVRTFSEERIDGLVMRHPEQGFAEEVAYHLMQTRRPIPVINAGSGLDQHPTQALLDWYTIKRCVGNLNGKTMIFAGDLRGRTVRSLVYLMKYAPGVHLVFVAPEEAPHVHLEPDIRAFLDRRQISYEIVYELEPHIHRGHVIYMTRVQDEYDKKVKSLSPDKFAQFAASVLLKLATGQELSEEEVKVLQTFANADFQFEAKKPSRKYYPKVAFRYKHLGLLRDDAIVLHPLPRRDELDWRCDDDPRIRIWSETRNGVWARTSLLAYHFKVDEHNTVADRIRADWPQFFPNREEVA